MFNDAIFDGTVREPKLRIDNTPSDGQVLSWNETDGEMEWVDAGGGGETPEPASGGLTYTLLVDSELGPDDICVKGQNVTQTEWNIFRAALSPGSPYSAISILIDGEYVSWIPLATYLLSDNAKSIGTLAGEQLFIYRRPTTKTDTRSILQSFATTAVAAGDSCKMYGVS